MQPRLLRLDSQPAAPTTLRAVIDIFLDHSRAEQNERTYESRQRHLEAFARLHGGLALTDAKPWHLRLWVDAQKQWRSDWTKKGVISSIQRAFNWACKLGIIERNPFWGVSNREGEPGRAMTDGEYRAALRSSSQPFRRVLVFLRYTGCRPCECSVLEPGYVDWDRGIAVIDKHKTSRTQKQRKPRVIVLHPVALKLLAYLARTMIPEQTTLFINSRGTAWTRYALACRMKRLRNRLKLPADCKTYGLRHKFGTGAILNGVEIKTVATLMGHATVRTTERYVHVENAYGFLAAAVVKAVH